MIFWTVFYNLCELLCWVSQDGVNFYAARTSGCSIPHPASFSLGIPVRGGCEAGGGGLRFWRHRVVPGGTMCLSLGIWGASGDWGQGRRKAAASSLVGNAPTGVGGRSRGAACAPLCRFLCHCC